MKILYDQNYYERGIELGVSCYSNYRWIPELTIPMAARLVEYLKISEEDTILDFGCAKGYLVKALRLLHRKAYGFDISEYACQNVPQEVQKYIVSQIDGLYSWVIAKDVFEHIAYEEIDAILKNILKHARNLFAIIPLGKDGVYVVPAYELDKTHIIREDLDWWKAKFEDNGFEVLEASYKVKHIKENWAAYETGNGFFTLRCGGVIYG